MHHDLHRCLPDGIRHLVQERQHWKISLILDLDDLRLRPVTICFQNYYSYYVRYCQTQQFSFQNPNLVGRLKMKLMMSRRKSRAGLSGLWFTSPISCISVCLCSYSQWDSQLRSQNPASWGWLRCWQHWSSYDTRRLSSGVTPTSHLASWVKSSPSLFTLWTLYGSFAMPTSPTF